MSPVSRRPGGILGVLAGVLVLTGSVIGVTQVIGSGGSNSCTLSDATGCAKQAGLTITWNNPTEANSDTSSLLIRCTGSVLSYRPAGYISNPSSPDWTVSGSGYPVRWIINWPTSPDYIDRSGILLDSGCTANDDAGRGTRPNLIINMGGDGINYGVEGDALKARVGAHDIDITGSINCGPGNFNPATGTGVHPDGIQLVGGDNLGFYDVTVGNWNGKQSTCEGSGGAFFISNANSNVPTNIVVRRMKAIACNKGLNANAGDATSTGSIQNSFFRAGNPSEQAIVKANGLTGICQTTQGGIYNANVPTNVPLWSFSSVAGQTYPYNEPFTCTQNQTICLNVGGGTGNVFVASNGSDTGTNCVRFSSPVAFPADPTTVCRTIDKADSLLQNGDNALIAGGTYPGQTIQRHTIRTAPATMTVVAGQTMVLGGLSVETNNLNMVGPFDGTGNSLSIQNPNDNIAQTFLTHDITIDNFKATNIYMRAAFITLKNGVIGPGHAMDANGGVCDNVDANDLDGIQISALAFGGPWVASHDITIDNVTIHDIDRWLNPANPAGGSCSFYHTDGLQGFGADHLTIKNSHIYRTATSYILIKPEGGATMNNITIVNNMFGRTLEGGHGILLGDPGQTCGPNITVQNNTFGGDFATEEGCSGTPGVFRNNAVAVAGFICSGAAENLSFSYNTFLSSASSSCTTSSHAQTCTPTFADANRDTNGNYTRLSTDSCATNKGDPANFTTPDIFGIARPIGAAPDAAADEY